MIKNLIIKKERKIVINLKKIITSIIIKISMIINMKIKINSNQIEISHKDLIKITIQITNLISLFINNSISQENKELNLKKQVEIK